MGIATLDHAPGAHDDLANAVAGAVVLVTGRTAYHPQIVTLSGFGNDRVTTTVPTTITLEHYQDSELRLLRDKGVPVKKEPDMSQWTDRHKSDLKLLLELEPTLKQSSCHSDGGTF